MELGAPADFSACILRRSTGIVGARKIKQRISQRLDLWREGRIEALVSQIESKAKTAAGGKRGERNKERAVKAFDSAVLDGKVRSVVRRLTERKGGGVLSPNDKGVKGGPAQAGFF